MARATSKTLPPPYMSYGMFTKSIEIFVNSTVPTGAIDRRVLREYSGAGFGALMSGLAFLGLVDDERKATDTYRDLVKLSKDTAKFKARLKQIVDDRYKPIVVDLDLAHGTSAQLEKAFKDYGVAQGQMLTKSIRFFLKAAEEAGYQLSPFLTAPKPRTSNGGTRRNNTARAHAPVAQREQQRQERHTEEMPTAFERMGMPGVPNCFIQYPSGLTEAQCDILDGMITVLRTSIKARSGGKGKQP